MDAPTGFTIKKLADCGNRSQRSENTWCFQNKSKTHSRFPEYTQAFPLVWASTKKTKIACFFFCEPHLSFENRLESGTGIMIEVF